MAETSGFFLILFVLLQYIFYITAVCCTAKYIYIYSYYNGEHRRCYRNGGGFAGRK